MRILINDIKYTFRQFRKNPGFTAMVVLTLALCIGVNTAMLGVLYRVVLKPLPFPNSERLVRIQVHHQASDRTEPWLSVSEFRALSTNNEAFEDVAAFSGEICNLSGIGSTRRAWGTRVSPEFFNTFGVTPVIGRAFLPEDYAPGGDYLVLLSNGLRHECFGGRSDVLGKSFLLDGKSVTVCGVMPSSFRFPHNPSYWTPLVPTSEEISETDYRFLSIVGRLKPGISNVHMGQLLHQFTQGYTEQQATIPAGEITFVGRSLLEVNLGQAGRILWILFGAVSCVTLIGSANLINLYLAHLGKRRKELVVRRVLGAEGRHLFRQWLTESCLLYLIAGLTGVTLSTWFIHLLRFFAPYGLPRAAEIAVDPLIVGYGFVLALLVGVGMSIIPLLYVLKQDRNADSVLRIREGDGHSARPQTRFWLVTTQATIATLLLINAGLLWNSFRTVMGIDPGFSTDHILTARIVLSSRAYDDDNILRNFYRRLTDRVQALPEVSGVAMVNALPLSEINFDRPFNIENLNKATEHFAGNPPRANYTSASTNYFQLMDIPILAGRTFEPIDEEGAAVVIVNKSFATRFFPEGQAVGQRIKLGPGQWRPWMTIVGISEDVKSAGRDAPSEPTFYVPFHQKKLATHTMRGMFLIVKTFAPPDAVIQRMRSELNTLDPSLALANIDTMNGRLRESVANRRYHSTLMGLFAVLALTIAMIGIFGVLSSVVTHRRHEIGIRMALGSNRIDLFRLILKQGLKPVLIGMMLGWLLSWISQSLLKGFLFGVSPNDPVTLISAGLLFLITATVACLLPAYRAAMIDPMEALRYE